MSLFKSFFLGGFECSTHYGPHRKRLDVLATTQHDRFAALDYARLQNYGIFIVREGVRWYRIETMPGHYRFGDMLNIIHAYSNARYEAWDMLVGNLHPELGGAPKYLDILGVDYYPWNQWFYISDVEAGEPLRRDDPQYIPLHQLLAHTYERYKRPLLITETSTEGALREDWLAYMGSQVRMALQAGISLEGVCWYPIVDYPRWDNDRPCKTGFWGMCNEEGDRPIYEPLVHELTRQAALIQRLRMQR